MLKNVTVAFFVCLSFGPVRATEACSDDFKKGMLQAYDDICRGSSGDEQATQRACDKREEIAKELAR